MASSGGFKPSHLPTINETGMRGFLKWLQRENPPAYQHIAPSLPAVDPRMFSDYNQSRAQIVRGRAGNASLVARAASLGALGQAEYSSQIQTLSESDLTPINVSVDDSTLTMAIPTNVDTTDA